MKRKVHPLAAFLRKKRQIIDKIGNIPICQSASASNKIAGKTVLLNITVCIHCMKCTQSCPMHVFEIQEYNNSQIVLPIGESNCIQCQRCTKCCPSDSIYINETLMNGIWIAVREVISDKLQKAYDIKKKPNDK